MPIGVVDCGEIHLRKGVMADRGGEGATNLEFLL